MQNTSGGIQHILLRLILLERVNTVKKPQMNNFDCIGLWHRESPLEKGARGL